MGAVNARVHSNLESSHLSAANYQRKCDGDWMGWKGVGVCSECEALNFMRNVLLVIFTQTLSS